MDERPPGTSSDDVNEPIRVVSYDPQWPALFEREAALLGEAIGVWAIGGIHHVGSTSVPGLAAKPTIDIAIGVADLSTSRPCIDILADLHYCYWPYRAEVMHWFCKPHQRRRTHHLHLIPTDSPRFREEITFRDYLRTHPTSAERYQLLKQRLARKYPRDREAYTQGKADLVGELTTAALVWQDSRPR
ncbi:MAG TPA: GrpB family protein [Mycobacterium sp.]|jgi:GrpB-like predicted nucleotidyltransferase (UPF0157 family)|nr:GrpB family protein [Mycobacterium sp.]